MVDIAKAIEPRSDQRNYVDYIAGPQVHTVAGVDEDAEGRVSIHLAEHPGRPFKPSRTNLRLIAIGWGDNADTWPGRRIKLGGDPTVTFGREQVGGIRVLALSDIEKPYTAKLPITRGKRGEFRVERLDTATPPPIPTFATVDDARAHYTERAKAGATPAELDAIKAAAPTQNEEN